MGQVLNYPFDKTNQGLCFKTTPALHQETFEAIYAVLRLELGERVQSIHFVSNRVLYT